MTSIVDAIAQAEDDRKELEQKEKLELQFAEILSKIHSKGVLVIDKNFHLYIHGDRTLMEAKRDERGKYLKLYFNNID